MTPSTTLQQRTSASLMSRLSAGLRRARLLAPLLALACLCAAPAAHAQFSAAGSAAAESAAESAGRRDAVASYGKRNVYRAGRTVRVGSTIEGDFHAAGSRVVIDAGIQGDASLLGGAVELRSPIGGDLRTAAGKLSLDANVGGDALIAGSEISLGRAVRVGGDALIAGRSVEIAGSVGGDLTVYAQQVVIAGPIGGKVHLVAEEIELLEGARIGGTLSYTSPNEIKRAPASVIAGEVTRTEREQKINREANERRRTEGSMRWDLLGILLWSVGLFLFAAAMMSVFPGATTAAAQRISAEPLASLGLGFALLVGTPVAAGLAIMTIVGIPLGASALALYPVLLLVGYLNGVWSVALRARLALVGTPTGSRPAMLLWLAGALVVVLLVGIVPFLGWIISAWITLVGLGGMTLSLWQSRRSAS
jgi:cytoskeletal protein CcmA (bactofilin family)